MAGPISVEDMLAKQKAEREAAAKPKFLTKAERAKLALEKRNAEVKAQQEKDNVEKQDRKAFEQAAEEERRRAEAAKYGDSRHDRYGGRDRDGRYDRNGRDDYRQRNGSYNNQNGSGPSRNDRYPAPNQRGAPTGPRGNGPPSGPKSMQNGSSSTYAPSPLANSSSPAPSSPKPNTPGDVAMPTDTELNSIRARYLGQKTVEKKPRLRKEADKRFIFDWKPEEDTSTSEMPWAVDLRGQGHVGALQSGLQQNGAQNGHENGQKEEKYADPLERRRAGRGNTDERHWSQKPLEDMKDRDWRIFREDFNIACRGGVIPLPIRSWKESIIPSQILEVIEEVGYKEPSPIQRAAIPLGLTNRDLIGIAQTGSGKTAAFAIPMLTYISHLPALNDDNRHLGPYALILAPTRELAQQIEGEVAKFASRLGYTSVSIVGGKAVEEQLWQLRNGAEIVIATPGRLKDMLDKSQLVLSQCRYVVLDEADRCLDLGFDPELNFILDAMPSTFVKPDDESAEKGSVEFQGWRVTSLYSATMPPAVQRLAMKYLRKPATVTIGVAGETVGSVNQRVEFIHSEDKKRNRLIEILRSGEFPAPIIIFANQKKQTEVILRYVHQAGLSGTTLHSDKTQEQREEALLSVRDGSCSVLVATEVAARGIDIPDVSLVVNFQMSTTIEAYVHRIGRTGRAGKKGTAITFLTNDDDEVMYELKQEIQKSPVSQMNPELARHEAARQKVTREMKRKRDELGDE